MTKDKNIQPNTNRIPQKQALEKTAAEAGACFPGTPFTSNDLQESRSSPTEMGEANGDPHEQDQGEKTPSACWSRAEQERATWTFRVTTVTREGRQPQQEGPCRRNSSRVL